MVVSGGAVGHFVLSDAYWLTPSEQVLQVLGG
jgi:hypothetical protein